MKTALVLKINNQYNKQNIAFGAGLTPKMMQEIQSVDILKISDRLAQKGIPTDFKDNKVIAWCCEKTVNIFEQLNEKYGIKLSLPKGIRIADFKDLDTDSPNAYGFCNLAPMKLVKGSEKDVPSRILFFNTQYNWNDVDLIANKSFELRHSSTDFFLYLFIHEFVHAAHEDKLLEKFNEKKLLNKILKVKNPQQIQKYQQKYKQEVSKICRYALTDPIEAIACDIPRYIVKSIDPDSLELNKNPFSGSPYENLSFWKKINMFKQRDQNYKLNKIMKRFWNGQFD